jgi:phenylalanyl-tRNA synthetase beta chain
MLLPIDWLKQFVKVKHSPEELAEIFVSLGFEAEEIKNGILDLEVTPNRGDCLSILGLAREYAAKTNQKLNLPDCLDLKFTHRSKQLKISFEKPQLCPRYTAAIITDIKLKPSSPEIQTRLRQMRLEPINNIVDITNLVMFELGQPLHAFALDKIKGKEMTIRLSQPGESLVTLDNKFHQLPKGAIVIEDKKNLIDLAGIMGGENSQISKNTHDILLQAALFDPKTIRRTARLLNHKTEASYRYEREVDNQALPTALARGAQLIKQEGGGQILEVFDIKNQSPKSSKIKLNFSQIEKLIGAKIDKKQAIDYLERLGIRQSGGSFIPPSWRHDLFWAEDLIEEIIRLYDYNRLKKRLIKKQTHPNQQIYERSFDQKLKLKKYLVSRGLTEVQTYSFISEKEFQALDLPREKILKPSNPVSADYRYLRPNFLPGLLKTLGENRWCPKDELNIFEVGKIFEPQERLFLAIATYMPKLIEGLKLNLTAQTIYPEDPLAQLYKLKKPIYFCQIPVKEIDQIPDSKPPLKSPSEVRSFSDVTPAPRDFAWMVDKTVSTEEIGQTILQTDSRIITSSLFDEFEDDRFGRKKKSVAFHTVLDNPEKSLTAIEIKQISDKIIKAVEQKYNAKLRK